MINSSQTETKSFVAILQRSHSFQLNDRIPSFFAKVRNERIRRKLQPFLSKAHLESQENDFSFNF